MDIAVIVRRALHVAADEPERLWPAFHGSMLDAGICVPGARKEMARAYRALGEQVPALTGHCIQMALQCDREAKLYAQDGHHGGDQSDIPF